MLIITHLKTNISPEKWWLEDVFPIGIVPFWGTYVSFLGCKGTKGFPAIFPYESPMWNSRG